MSFYEESNIMNTQRTDRYRNCKSLKDKDTGISLLSTRDVSDIPQRETDIFHTVKYHEVGRLDLIAYKYYNNPLLWWVIAQANDIYDPITSMTTGMVVRVPLLETLYGNGGILL